MNITNDPTTIDQATALRREYETRLQQHPDLAKLHTPTPATTVPRLVTDAMKDEDYARVITVARQKSSYENDIDDLARRRLAKQPVSMDEQLRVIQQGDQIERGLRDSAGAVFRRARFDPVSKAYAAAVADHPVPREIYDSVPAYLTEDERGAMTYVGWGPDHPIWQELPRHSTVPSATTFGETLARTADRLQQLECAANKLDYSRAPRHLIGEHILTLAGGDWLSDLIVFLIFVFIFLPWLFFESIRTIESGIWDSIRGIFGL